MRKGLKNFEQHFVISVTVFGDLVVVKIGACMCGWNFVGSITQWDETLYDQVSEIL